MATATALLEVPDLSFAELWCPPDDPEWGEDNYLTRHIVALPSTPVWQSHDGAERRLFNQNHALFHHPGSEYRRERFQGVGYRCLFLVPAGSLLGEMVGEGDPATTGSTIIRFPASSGALDGRTFALSRMAAGYLRSGPSDPNSARELLYVVLRGALGASRLPLSSGRPTCGATRRARMEIVEEAKRALTERMTDQVSLDELARGLFTSAYHLARLFRATTGFSVHGYQVQLRLRAGLERIQSPSADIGAVGLQLGYSSASHFTSSFRRAFGLTPSGVRAFSPQTR
jgi:AraC family transcriptional regulator